MGVAKADISSVSPSSKRRANMAQETPRWKANVRTVTSKAEELALTLPLLLFEKSHCAFFSTRVSLLSYKCLPGTAYFLQLTLIWVDLAVSLHCNARQW